jgi:hypothetical protein
MTVFALFWMGLRDRLEPDQKKAKTCSDAASPV